MPPCILFLINMIFERKKIQIETLSEYLKEVRQSLGLSLEEVSKRTHIKPRFLEYLEEGNLNQLPPDVYVLGFLRQLAQLYTIEPSVLVDQYKKERGILKQVNQKSAAKPFKRKGSGKLVLTPASLSIAVGVLFVLLTVGYIVFQVYSINRAPSLQIFEPQDRQVIKDSFVNVHGQTDPGMSVTVNRQDVFVGNNGDFKTQLGITPGPRDLQITAQNKFGKQTTKTVSIVGESTQAAPDASTTSVQLKLDFTGDVTITFTLDDQNPQTVSFHNGDSKLLMANNKAVISTSDAGATKVTLNGQPLGPLGRSKEVISNIPFFAETDNIDSGQ